MISKYHQKQQLHEPMTMISPTPHELYLNKVVISLDNLPIGRVTSEENNMIIITNDNSGKKFIIPSCKVISVDKGSLTLDIELYEADKYRIAEYL
jgi:hypothetical protein